MLLSALTGFVIHMGVELYIDEIGKKWHYTIGDEVLYNHSCHTDGLGYGGIYGYHIIVENDGTDGKIKKITTAYMIQDETLETVIVPEHNIVKKFK
jgi:hypothetical protein